MEKVGYHETDTVTSQSFSPLSHILTTLLQSAPDILLYWVKSSNFHTHLDQPYHAFSASCSLSNPYFHHHSQPHQTRPHSLRLAYLAPQHSPPRRSHLRSAGTIA